MTEHKWKESFRKVSSPMPILKEFSDRQYRPVQEIEVKILICEKCGEWQYAEGPENVEYIRDCDEAMTKLIIES
jgi:hypothetical protein